MLETVPRALDTHEIWNFIPVGDRVLIQEEIIKKGGKYKYRRYAFMEGRAIGIAVLVKEHFLQTMLRLGIGQMGSEARILRRWLCALDVPGTGRRAGSFSSIVASLLVIEFLSVIENSHGESR